jgi:hypothetical protein
VKKFRTHGFLLVLVLSVMLSGCFGFLVPEPTVTVEGIEDEGVYAEPVTPTIKAGKKTEIESITLTKDGVEVDYVVGATLEEVGEYELTIVAKAGTKDAVFTYKFAIVEIAIEIKNIEEGKMYTEITPEVTVTGADSYVLKLNGEEIDADKAITKPGKYTLEVVATAGEQSLTKSVSFIVVKKKFEHDDSKLDGLWHDRGSAPELNEDPAYIKEGDFSLKFTNQADQKSAFRWNRDPKGARIWPEDWTEYTHWSMWIYIEDKTPLNEIEFALGTSAGTLSKKWSSDQLVDGWNLIEIDLKDYAGENWEALGNLYYDEDGNGKYESFLDIIVRSSAEMTLYFDQVTWYSMAE